MITLQVRLNYLKESASGSSLNAPALSSKKLLFSFSAPQLHVTPKELKQSPKSCKVSHIVQLHLQFNTKRQ